MAIEVHRGLRLLELVISAIRIIPNVPILSKIAAKTMDP